MDVSLRILLAEGVFGDLCLGSSMATVTAALGEPMAQSIDKRPLTMKYGDLEVAFDGEVLISITLYCRGQGLPASVRFVDWVPRADTTLDQFVGYLSQEQIGCERIETLTFDDQIGLKVGCGVTVVFEKRGSGVCLDSIDLIDSKYARRTSMRRAIEVDGIIGTLERVENEEDSRKDPDRGLPSR